MLKPGDKVTVNHHRLKGRDWTIEDRWGSDEEGYEYSMVENGIIRQLLDHEFGARVIFLEEHLTKVYPIAGLEWDKLMNDLKGLTGVSNG